MCLSTPQHFHSLIHFLKRGWRLVGRTADIFKPSRGELFACTLSYIQLPKVLCPSASDTKSPPAIWIDFICDMDLDKSFFRVRKASLRSFALRQPSTHSVRPLIYNSPLQKGFSPSWQSSATVGVLIQVGRPALLYSPVSPLKQLHPKTLDASQFTLRQLWGFHVWRHLTTFQGSRIPSIWNQM